MTADQPIELAAWYAEYRKAHPAIVLDCVTSRRPRREGDLHLLATF